MDIFSIITVEKDERIDKGSEGDVEWHNMRKGDIR
jgi:hypothetical protein